MCEATVKCVAFNQTFATTEEAMENTTEVVNNAIDEEGATDILTEIRNYVSRV